MPALIAALLGAAWRRWFGSARAEWAYPGYRATQVVSGFCVLAFIQFVQGEALWRCALDGAIAIGFMTLPIHISRRPFEWVAERLHLPTTDGMNHPWKTMLQGPAPWAEVMQGATLWALATIF